MEYQKMAQYAADSYKYSNQMVVVGNTVAHIYVEKDITTIAVRGTDDCVDWINNLNKFKVPFVIDGISHGSVHSGFLHEMLSIFPFIKTNTKVQLVGHSLGGAIAVLMGLYLAKTQPYEVSVVTFGTPRIGDKRFRDRCCAPNLKIDRIFNSADIVTHVPYFGYYHVGTPHVFNDSKVHQIVKNHSMSNYLHFCTKPP